MDTAEPTPHQIEMMSRVRRHMLVSFAGIFVCFGVMMGGGAIGAAVFTSVPDWWMGLCVGVGLVGIPAIGFTSTFRNLRCPACGGLVAWQVSARYSAFAATAADHCRHCGVKIFADRKAGSVRGMFVIIAVVIVLLGVVGAVSAVVSGR